MPAETPAEPLPQLNVLVVEDSPADARLLVEALKEAGVDAQLNLNFVRSLAEAENAMRSGSFDCVLLDLGLPDAHGVDNVQRVRAVNRWQTVVVMTGLDSEEAALGTLQRGAQDYLVKGRYNGDVLIRIIRRAIERNRVLSEVDRLREEQYFLATHDALTGLPNRQLFDDRARRALAQAERQAGILAIGYLDLNGFKPVNDNYGHAVGDALLRRVGRTLLDSVRTSDTVARVGGDEFLFLLAPLHDRAEAETVFNRLHERIAAIRDVEGRSVSISASIGLAFFPQHARTLEALLAHADQAMYAAKRAAHARAAKSVPSATRA